MLTKLRIYLVAQRRSVCLCVQHYTHQILQLPSRAASDLKIIAWGVVQFHSPIFHYEFQWLVNNGCVTRKRSNERHKKFFEELISFQTVSGEKLQTPAKQHMYADNRHWRKISIFGIILESIDIHMATNYERNRHKINQNDLKEAVV